MTDDSSSETFSVTNNPNLSSWNFDNLQHEDESNSTNDFFSVLKKSVSKHVYLDEPISKHSLSERSTTIRIDNSDLISRCKQFLPLLTDANRTLLSKIESGENVRIELDSDHEEEEERRIEMNLMFCPNVDSSSSESENNSEESDDDEPTKSVLLQLPKKKIPVNIVEIQSTNIIQDDIKSEENGAHN